MYRFYEMSLGLAAWGTLLILIGLSWLFPEGVAVFIILFDTYWLLKTVYLFIHLKHSYSRLKQNTKINWLEKIEKDKENQWEKIHHLIIIPALKEPYKNIQKCLESIRNANYPKERKIVILALEEAGGMEDQKLGEKAKTEFKDSFGEFHITTHPQNIENELAGKGSNQTFAAKFAEKEIVQKKKLAHENIILSVFDSDAQVGKEYFGIITHTFLNSEKPLQQSYQPTPVFTNNIYEVSFLSRILSFSCTFWQLMQQARPSELTTFSSHSMSWKTLVDVGFYNTKIVSEDSHIFFQCLIHFKGDYKTVPIEYPIYMDSVGGENIVKSIKNIYKQQRRWAYGAENLAFMYEKFRNDKTNEISKKIKRFWRWKLWAGLFSWSTSSFILFVFGWLPLIIGKPEFQNSVLAHNLPIYTSTLMNVSMIGIVISAVISTTLLPKPPEKWTWISYALYLLEWIFTPIAFVTLSGVPALDAQTRLVIGGKLRLGFWRTPKHK